MSINVAIYLSPRISPWVFLQWFSGQEEVLRTLLEFGLCLSIAQMHMTFWVNWIGDNQWRCGEGLWTHGIQNNTKAVSHFSNGPNMKGMCLVGLSRGRAEWQLNMMTVLWCKDMPMMGYVRILPSDARISGSCGSKMHWLTPISSCKYISSLYTGSLGSIPCQSFNHHSETFHVITLDHSMITFQDMVKWHWHLLLFIQGTFSCFTFSI